MLPANPDDRTVHVHRSLDAEEEDVLDALTAFAEAQALEVDRRHEGPGLLFYRGKREEGQRPILRTGDTLHVTITATADGHDVEMTADLRGSVARASADHRRHVIRGYALAGLFGVLGVRGLSHGVSLGDFILLGLSARFGWRGFDRSQSSAEKVDELQRKVANELNRVCDEAELPD